MSVKSEWKDLIRACEQQGGRVQQTKKGLMIYPADKTKPAVTLHRTPSDQRALKNTIALLRKSGFDV